MNNIRTLLATSEYSCGDKLPTERELSEILSVSRRAVRKAMEFLDAEGKVWRHVGKGTFVGPRPTVDTNHIASRTNPDEIMEVRLSLEPNLARLAALRATTPELEHMRTCHRGCVHAKSLDVYEKWDSALHSAIAEASHNALFISLFNTINPLRVDATWGQFSKNSQMRKNQEFFAEQHLSIIEAISDRNPKAAAKFMATHISSIRELLLEGNDSLVWIGGDHA